MEAIQEPTPISETPAKVKKPRSEAQQEATRKALLALEAKRKQNWEEKKEKMIKEKEALKVSDDKPTLREEPKQEVVAPPAPKPRVSFAPAKVEGKPDMGAIPEWAKALSDKIDMVASNIKPKKAKKVIIEEESSSSEEEIVIRRKKDKSVQPPAPIQPVITPQEAQSNQFKNFITKRW